IFRQDAVLYKTDHTILRILVKFSWHIPDFPIYSNGTKPGTLQVGSSPNGVHRPAGDKPVNSIAFAVPSPAETAWPSHTTCSGVGSCLRARFWQSWEQILSLIR
ncbi:hypothetical protein ACUY3S_09670, partial [Corynebacterium resistens]